MAGMGRNRTTRFAKRRGLLQTSLSGVLTQHHSTATANRSERQLREICTGFGSLLLFTVKGGTCSAAHLCCLPTGQRRMGSIRCSSILLDSPSSPILFYYPSHATQFWVEGENKQTAAATLEFLLWHMTFQDKTKNISLRTVAEGLIWVWNFSCPFSSTRKTGCNHQ